MIPDFKNLVNGSSLLPPANGLGGSRAAVPFPFRISAPPSFRSKNFRAKPNQAGKKEGGLGEGIFARLLCPPKAGWGVGSVSAVWH